MKVKLFRGEEIEIISLEDLALLAAMKTITSLNLIEVIEDLRAYKKAGKYSSCITEEYEYRFGKYTYVFNVSLYFDFSGKWALSNTDVNMFVTDVFHNDSDYINLDTTEADKIIKDFINRNIYLKYE